MSIQKVPDERKTFVSREVALEIIGVGEESRKSTVTYSEPFTFGDARSLVTDETILCFYGQAEYVDTFGVSIRLDWEFIGLMHRSNRPSYSITLPAQRRSNLCILQL
jgi:hypothetical protein